jgi:hypothetical protein
VRELLRLVWADIHRLGRLLEEVREQELMGLISKDDLWQVTAQLPWEDVPIRKPPSGEVVGTMRLRGMSGEEVNEWQDASTQQIGKRRRQSKHSMAMLIVKCAINEDGSQKPSRCRRCPAMRCCS